MLSFDEIAIRNEFIEHIKEVFNKQYDIIGSEVEVAPRESQDATFPCCLVNLIEPVSAENYADSGGTFQFVNFSLNCDLYSKELNNFSIDDSIIKLSNILINGILEKYSNLIVTRNSNVPFRTDTLRRTITFRCTYDSKNKIIYSN